VAGEGRRVATSVDTAEAPRQVPARRGARLPMAWLGVVPFFLYTLLFLFLPGGQVLVGAFQGVDGGFTFSNIEAMFHEPYITAFKNSIEVSLVTALLGGAVGFLIAYSAIREGTPKIVRTVLTTFSGVAANFAGIPLAFAWIATLGVIGIVTQWLIGLGFNPYDHGFSLFSKTGIELVYLYFQIPLMVLVIAPAIDGLRREWREAAANLGATPLEFWRHVGLPILTPPLLGAIVLLFGNSFAAYATAYGLTGGQVGLVPITIGYLYSGDVLDNPHLAEALALGMFGVLTLMMAIYIPLNRISSRWVR
jgi:putative spermidine/putrescine transport system permease protein